MSNITTSSATIVNKWEYDNLGREVFHRYHRLNLEYSQIDSLIEESTYNNDGYLLEQKRTGKNPDYRLPFAVKKKFEYAANRLVKATDFDQYSNVIELKTYEYDDMGYLIRCINQVIHRAQTFTYLYKNGKQIDFFETLSNGKVNKGQIFENGRVSASVNYKGEITGKLKYDAQGRVIRTETYEGGRLFAYDEIEYIDGIHPDMTLYYPKGWPEEMRFVEHGLSESKVLVKRRTSYRIEPFTRVDFESKSILSKNAFDVLEDIEGRYHIYNQDGGIRKSGEHTAKYFYEGCK